MKKLIYLVAIPMVLGVAQASPPSADLDRIRSLAGCFEVKFEYAETFPRVEDYQHRPTKTEEALEWVSIEVDDGQTIELQHVLSFGPHAPPLKHWSEIWKYEPEEIWDYEAPGLWIKKKMDASRAKGKWLQRVIDVVDAPRYQCLAPWLHSEGQGLWDCTAWSPLPRRERKRKDYNVLERRNRIQTHARGYDHEQDNNKINVQGLGQNRQVQSIVEEKGWNRYTRVDASRCDAAKKGWESVRPLWAEVRTTWEELQNEVDELSLNLGFVDGKLHHEPLRDLIQDAASQGMSAEQIRKNARAIIDRYR